MPGDTWRAGEPLAAREDTVSQPVVELQDIVLERDGVRILDGVSWTVRRGEHWALLGANGCGKTTLLKVVAGYEWPTTGSVSVLGEKFGETDLRVLRRRIGWVSSAIAQRFPQDDSALKIALSGYEASMGLWREFSAQETERAHRALEETGAAAIADRPWKVLSQGERQRVLIARSLVNDPPLMILDEPCAGLDPAARERFLDDMEALAAKPDAPCLVLVTHHVEEIRPFVSRTLAMRDGKAIACGPTGECLTQAVLARAFGRPCELSRGPSGWRLDFPA